MANTFWIKLYHEVLDDPKMARLTDRLWRRVVELFLLAGETGSDGNIAGTSDIAWRLRVNSKTLQKDLEIIESLGIIQPTSKGWLVVNFEKRNAPIPGTDRVRNFRETKRKEFGNADVTEVKRECNEDVTKRYIEKIREDTEKKREDTEKKREEEEPEKNPGDAVAAVFKSYECEIGLLTGTIADDIKTALEDYPREWFEKAFQESARQNKRSWKYALAILKRWKVEGFQMGSGKPQTNSGSYENWKKVSIG
jgi:DnaD/phage-associated family protein